MSEKFKWFEFGTSQSDVQFFICAASLDVSTILQQVADGTMTEDALGNLIIAQAQNAEWAALIVVALNGHAATIEQAVAVLDQLADDAGDAMNQRHEERDSTAYHQTNGWQQGLRRGAEALRAKIMAPAAPAPDGSHDTTQPHGNDGP